MRDADVRAAMRIELARDHAGDHDTRIVEEMGVWSSTVRIDMAVINGELSGYELKSDSDTLERLPYQSEIYSKVFDRVTLVAGARHYKKALKIVPRWWGCTVATMCDGAVKLRRVREAKRNPHLDATVVTQLLWKEEAIEILAEHGLAAGWRSKPASAIRERLASELTLDELCARVRFTLKRREKLGHDLSRNLNVPINVEADPSSGAACVGGGANILDSVTR